MSVSIHLHDGELKKVVEYCVDTYIAGIQCVYVKGIKSFTTNGSCKKSDERYRQAEQKLVSFTKNLTPAQRGWIDEAFGIVIDVQMQLQQDGLSKKERRKLAALYKKATQDYAKAINATSTQVSHDLTAHGESGKLSDGDEHDLNALEMAKGIQSAFNGSLPKAAPKRQASTDSAASQRISVNMMKQVALRVKDMKNA
ncbi:hypothetical protein PILCRDRAFT_5323 [Piloderma croceum F 1598]|uniref:Uncharacterized protein n=1 Tax=Piloderma croceum (strain F 1598) TaxID=765440 RepID=A0A0C3G4V9_PILCF|nr:hypothetical protein PILCRDRAFT_5323 [Piloderma croceum F 1598]